MALPPDTSSAPSLPPSPPSSASSSVSSMPWIKVDPQVTATATSPSATTPSLLSPPSSTSSSTEASIALAPQPPQHPPTNNDLALHTQLQLQTYLQDLEEAEAEEAHVEAAVHASLLPADGTGPATGAMDDPLLDPLSAPLHHPFTLGGPAFGFPGEIPSGTTTTTTTIGASDLLLPFTQTELTVESFQHQMHMLSLESAVLGLEGLTLHEDGGSTNNNGGAGADGNEVEGGGSGGLGRNRREHGGEHLHDFEEMDDDDEECLPPSETKYILYDDHVSPISIADALTILNGNLYGDMMDRETLLTEGWYQHQHLHPHLTLPRYHHHALEDEDMPINSDVLSTASSMINKAQLGRGFRGGVYEGRGQGEGREEEDMFDPADNSMAYLQDDTSQEVAHWLTNYGTTTTLDTVADQGICLEEDPLQGGGGLGPLGGLGISLNLAGNNVSPVTIHELFFSRYYSRIVYLNLWDTNLGTWGAQAVGGLLADRACRVQYLNLGCNRLKFEGIVQLSGLYKNESLVELDLSENNLGPKAVHSLQQIMVRLQKDKPCNIRRLNLSNNEINDVGCISIAKIILGTLLTHLDLSFNKISDWGASTILASFESNEPPLKDINMEANPLSFAGGVDLCKILALPQSQVTTLDLRGAKVTDVGIPYLAEALKSHQCPIMSLNLYDCQLTDAGIQKLAINLSVNRSLRVLGLGCNCIGDMGVLALSLGLRLNSHLEELDLSENDMALSRAGLEALITAMRTNTSLVDLRLDVDGHPHVVSRNHDSLFPDFEGEAEYQHQQQQQQQHQQQQQQQQQQQHQQSMVQPTGNLSTGPHIGEVMAPTHAAIAQPLQVATQPSFMQQMQQITPLIQTMQPQYQHHPHHPGQPHHPHGLYGQPGAAPVRSEEELERERNQLIMALATLKTYVRHNYKRTGKMRKLCFKTLAVARILMFAKDAHTYSSSTPQEEESAAAAAALAVISLQTGLPTPPFDHEPKTELDALDTMTTTTTTTTTTTEVSPDSPSTTGPKSTLAGLPWEIKEMILRRLDPDGLLSERQFQAIVHYGSKQWETVRQPWERWGEIRETILEKTCCYYYEP